MRAHDVVGEGKNIVLHRQKLIKLADSSENGWRFVDEYERNERPENSDDEKEIQKSEYRASRKMTSNRGRKRGAQHSGTIAAYIPVLGQSQGNYRGTNRRTATCYTCGKFGHWRSEGQAIKSAQGSGHVPMLMAMHSDKISTYYVNTHYSFDLNHIVERPKLIEKLKKLRLQYRFRNQ